MPGASYGQPGGSLEAGQDLSWAANSRVAEAGRLGEIEVGNALIDIVADTDGAVALHDAAIPIPGFSANIDHLVVAGTDILLIDAKRWSPALYFSLGSRAYRGMFHRCTFAEKKTMSTASRAIASFAAEFEPTLITPLVVITSRSSRQRVNTTLLRMPGAAVVTLGQMRRRVRTFTRRRGPADPALVAKLRTLLSHDPGAEDAAPATPEPMRPTADDLQASSLSQELPRLTEEN